MHCVGLDRLTRDLGSRCAGSADPGFAVVQSCG
jgi:hypothetical protein